MSAPLSFSDYRKIDAINWSSLKWLRESPRAYRHRRDNPTEATDAMRLGSLTHAAILEPDTVADLAVVSPFPAFTTKGAKAWRDEHRAAGRLVVTSDQYDRALAVRDAVRSHPAAANYLRRGEAERSIVWTDEPTGLTCKGRMDWWACPSIVDIKTTRSIDERRLRSQMESLGVFSQLAMYRMGALALGMAVDPRCVIIAVETEPPHDVGVFLLDPGGLREVADEVRALLDQLADCIERDEWPGRFPTETTLRRPAWAVGGDITFTDEE